MKKSKATILVIIFFLAGILLDRAFLYYEMGEKNKELLKEQEVIKKEYQMLIKRFDLLEQDLQFRMMMDSIIVDSLMNEE
ncbi:MAG: hypothetical protein KOO66_12175 [Bacteroidales bacterium]|nr:hypothetical protein [Bacteroidales bacterium]